MNSLIKLGENKIVQVVVDAPLNKVFDYEWVAQAQPQVGQIVSLEFGRNKTIGVIVSVGSSTNIEPAKIKSIQEIAPLPPLPIDLIDLASFSATYYQKPLGEILLSSIPKAWRDASRWALLAKEKKQKDKIICYVTANIFKKFSHKIIKGFIGLPSTLIVLLEKILVKKIKQ
mgnify:CR=1 FL=1